MAINDMIQEECKVLQSFFKEDLEFEFYDLRHTYAQFRLKSVSGHPVNSKILMDFYDDKIYMPASSRENYQGKLDVFIMGEIYADKESCIGSYSRPFTRSEYSERTDNPISIVDFVREASGYEYVPYNSVSGHMVHSKDPAAVRQSCLHHLGLRECDIAETKFFIEDIMVYYTDRGMFCHFPDETDPRPLKTSIQDIMSGDAFMVGGYIHTADGGAHQNLDESDDPWIVYDEGGHSWFAEDIMSDPTQSTFYQTEAPTLQRSGEKEITLTIKAPEGFEWDNAQPLVDSLFELFAEYGCEIVDSKENEKLPNKPDAAVKDALSSLQDRISGANKRAASNTKSQDKQTPSR